MSVRNVPRLCNRCQEVHAPPLMDDLCVRALKGAVGGTLPDNTGSPSADVTLQGAVSVLAESVVAMDARMGSMEELMKDFLKERKKKRKSKKKSSAKREASPSSAGSSSESSTGAESSGHSSESSVASGDSAGDRGRGRSKSKKSSKHRSSAASLLRKSEFTHKPYIHKGKPVDRFERLMVCSLRMMKDIMQSGRDVTGVLTHLIVLAEKAASGYYRVDSIIAYDRATRMAAAESGIGKFSIIDNSLVLQYLCYDASVNATKGPEQSARPSRSKRSGGMCFRFNKSTGCEREKCRYIHVCSNCGDGSHGLFGCRKPRLQGAAVGSGSQNN